MDKQRCGNIVNSIGQETESCAYAMEQLGEAARQFGEELAKHAGLYSLMARLDDWLTRLIEFVKGRLPAA